MSQHVAELHKFHLSQQIIELTMSIKKIGRKIINRDRKAANLDNMHGEPTSERAGSIFPAVKSAAVRRFDK